MISDTALFRDGATTYGFGPVVRELEFIAPMFERIVWVGFERPSESRRNLFDPIRVGNIDAVLLAPCGGDRLLDKLGVLLQFPKMAYVVAKHSISADVVHTRSPSNPAFIAVILSYLLKKKTWWNKYAGSWGDPDQPFFYGLQRRLLGRASHTNVTINGFWNEQPDHCASFENPCLTDSQIELGARIQSEKQFEAPFRLAFVGRLSNDKGVGRIIDALREINPELIERIDFVGDGPERDQHTKASEFLGEKAQFHGFQDTTEVHKILSDADFMLLPSKSEGFPKVVAEAACWGTIPIVSDVGSITDYIKDQEHGFVWNQNGSSGLGTLLKRVFTEDSKTLRHVSRNALSVAKLFTFDNFAIKLRKEILAKKNT